MDSVGDCTSLEMYPSINWNFIVDELIMYKLCLKEIIVPWFTVHLYRSERRSLKVTATLSTQLKGLALPTSVSSLVPWVQVD